MKAIVYLLPDADPGPTANEVILRAAVAFTGADVPDRSIVDHGPQENGLAIPLNMATITAASYSNAIEDAVITRAITLGLPTLARTDIFLPTYTRGT